MKIGQNEGLKESVGSEFFKDKNYGIRKNFDSKKLLAVAKFKSFENKSKYILKFNL